jgi:hypothetical protein
VAFPQKKVCKSSTYFLQKSTNIVLVIGNVHSCFGLGDTYANRVDLFFSLEGSG